MQIKFMEDFTTKNCAFGKCDVPKHK